MTNGFWVLLAASCAVDASNGSTESGSSQGDAAPDAPALAVVNPPPDSGTEPSQGAILLYAHTNKTLYQLNPQNLEAPLLRVGDFDCIGGEGDDTSMTDVGIGRTGILYGVSKKAAYRFEIKGDTVHCAERWPFSSSASFFGLTVAPANTVSTDEKLIAANDAGNLFSVETDGTTAIVGSFGKDPDGIPYGLSGDIVFLENAGSPIGFATVRACKSTCNGVVDTLIEIDVKKLKPGNSLSVVKKVRGELHHGSGCANPLAPALEAMYGIAAYKDKIYGFSRLGSIVEINNSDASVCLVAEPTAGGGAVAFAGAGVTTAAPVIAPPN